jgi:type VI secretion system protein ImpL
VLAFFDQHFDELYDGLKEMSLATMAGNRSAAMRPGVFTFPLEFASLKRQLRAFLATLFEENTWQFKPVLRGFYFTSALQEGMVENLSSRRVASRFDLKLQGGEQKGTQAEEQSGFFLLDLFRKVIFADKDLVKRYTSPAATRLKYAAFFAATVLLGCALGGWSWSYMGNRQLVANVQADLDKVMKMQARTSGLQSRLEALDILQDRIEQLEKYREDRPLALSFGLYQGEALERKLRDEYFAGVREVMVQPVAGALESLLAEMNANASQLDPNVQAAPGAKAGQPYQDVSATNVGDAYNALKTYLMLADKSHAEPGHLNDQLTRYWRVWLQANRGGMAKEQMIRSAERLMTFHLAHIQDPAWPQIMPKLSLLDTARENLRRVVRGTPARERVYADIRTRAATRFPAVTVARIVGEQDQALVVGSHAVPGAFTRDAWEKFVLGAIRDASNRELQSSDWVLKSRGQGRPDPGRQPGADPEDPDRPVQSRLRAGVGQVRAGRDDRRPERLRGQRAGHEPAGRPANLAAGQGAEDRLRRDLLGRPGPGAREPGQAQARPDGLVPRSGLRQAPSEARQIADAAAPLPGRRRIRRRSRRPARWAANSPASRAWSASRKRMPR